MQEHFLYMHTLIGTDQDIDQDLLLQAFTHKTFSADDVQAKIPHNERLEFLGDSILGAVVASFLYERYPDIAESQLTLTKIYLVREEGLAKVARKIDLGSQLRLGNGEDRSGGRNKDSVLSDALEALIGYMYLTHGREVVETFIETHIMSELDELQQLPGKSRKSRFQEYVQGRWKIIPVYTDYEVDVESTGNVLVYGADVYVGDDMIAKGQGPSKKKAQEQAAELAWKAMQT